MKIHAYYEPMRNSIAITMLSDDGESYVDPESIKFIKREGRYSIVPPTEQISHGEAQRLVDDFWNCGIKPTHRQDETIEMKCLKEHLSDIRYLCIEKERNK